MIKRSCDIILSVLGLLFLLPVFFIVPILIKFNTPGPAFFKQTRVGRNFNNFQIFKFRTMFVNADTLGPGITSKDDARVTQIGKFLRRYKIDELPQIFNVIKGEMSIVGPRPELPRYVGLYPSEYSQILQVKPGITDIASLTYRNEENLLDQHDFSELYYTHTILPNKICLSLNYVQNSSLFYDFKIILLTLKKILF
jgi:lipopolysaccharide/colanic/teichoic acid biosynthesis glycosyltransferase